MSKHSSGLLSSHPTAPSSFTNIDTIMKLLTDETFLTLTVRKRFGEITYRLLQLIKKAPDSSFMLGAVLEFIDLVNNSKVLNELYTFNYFEFWLNHFSDLSYDEIYMIRAKIAGKYIPRSDYQPFFPIGMNRIFSGTHFVTAHLSPDVDTMIASFWGWLDAFAARVGSGVHQWSLPDGPPDSPITIAMKEMIGSSMFTTLARTVPTLTLSAMDLVSRQNWVKERGDTLTSSIAHGTPEKAVTLVDELGRYLGDWRSSDFEIVRQIAILYKSTLRWFENNFHTKIISLFTNPKLSLKDLPQFYSSVFDVKIIDCEPALEFDKQQKADINKLFLDILKVPHGIEGTFKDLITAFKNLSFEEMSQFQHDVESLGNSNLFDEKGQLKENRPEIFHCLDTLIHNLDGAMKTARNYVERLDVVINIKHKVLQLPLVYLSLHNDVDEMRNKMQHYNYLTVIFTEQDGSIFPIGVVHDRDLRKNNLGTVSLRDFCNLEEMKKASYLEVISVVDHHKSSFQTFCVPSAIIGDVQSCNVLMAEQAFIINDRYSLRGMTLEQINMQIQQITLLPSTMTNLRLHQRLLQRKQVALQGAEFFINPQREYNEYLCYLHAILDDTDLLSKVSDRDINCVTELLNRMKSLSIHQEIEIISLDSIPKDKNFAKVAAQHILMNADMHSLYKKTFDYREAEVERDIHLCSEGNMSNLFADTKEQNGCARVGQTKMFSSNFPNFEKKALFIRTTWLNQAIESNRLYPEIDLHIHMISTISSAEEVYRNQIGPYPHQDELWLWIPSTRQAQEHLISFLSNFQAVTKNFGDSLSVELCGPNAQELDSLFMHYLGSPQLIIPNGFEKGLPMAILRFKPGSLNSRKAMITPNLPRLVS